MKGSHNSLTYASPKKWWGWLATPIWRCQRLNLRQQIERGVRCFDIRCAWDGCKFIGAHGLVDLKVNILSELYLISAYSKSKVYIRIILEKGGDDSRICQLFKEDVNYWKSIFPKLVFFCGRGKGMWNKVADVLDEPDVEQHVGSMKCRWGEIFPGLWALSHRKDIPDKYYSENLPIVLIDYVK